MGKRDVDRFLKEIFVKQGDQKLVPLKRFSEESLSRSFTTTFTPSVRAVTMLNIKGFAEKRLFFVNTECIIRTDAGVTSYNKMRIYLV